MVDDEESKKIEDSVLNYKSVYSLYLGVNNHFANISDIGILEAKEITEKDFIINSLIKDEEIALSKVRNTQKDLFYYEYVLPTKLSTKTNIYKKEDFVLTNDMLELKKNKAYNVNGVNVVFY